MVNLSLAGGINEILAFRAVFVYIYGVAGAVPPQVNIKSAAFQIPASKCPVFLS